MRLPILFVLASAGLFAQPVPNFWKLDGSGNLVPRNGRTIGGDGSAISGVAGPGAGSTGTTAACFQIDNDATGPKVCNSSGDIVIKTSADVVMATISTAGVLTLGDGTAKWQLESITQDSLPSASSTANTFRLSMARTGDLLSWITNGLSRKYVALGDSTGIPVGDDTAYDATTWNASTKAPTQNAVRDKIELLAPLASPTFTSVPAAPTAAADTNTTQIATTAFYVGQKGTATPLVEGTATAGSSLKFAPIDHVHPTRTMTLPFGCAVGDPAGSALATGVLCYVTVPMAGTITGWDIIVDAGTATVDVLKIATGTAKPTASIAASALPAIATGTAIHSTTLTSWTTSVAANDMLGFNMTAVSTAKYITVNVQIAF